MVPKPLTGAAIVGAMVGCTMSTSWLKNRLFAGRAVPVRVHTGALGQHCTLSPVPCLVVARGRSRCVHGRTWGWFTLCPAQARQARHHQRYMTLGDLYQLVTKPLPRAQA